MRLGARETRNRSGFDHDHPLVAPHVSHFSHVPFRTIVKLWHSEQELPVQPCISDR